MDTLKDFAFASEVYATLYPYKRDFATDDILA